MTSLLYGPENAQGIQFRGDGPFLVEFHPIEETINEGLLL